MLAFWFLFSGLIVGFVLGEIAGASWTMHRYRVLFKRESAARDSVMKQIFESGVAVGKLEARKAQKPD